MSNTRLRPPRQPSSGSQVPNSPALSQPRLLLPLPLNASIGSIQLLIQGPNAQDQNHIQHHPQSTHPRHDSEHRPEAMRPIALGRVTVSSHS